MSNLDLEHPGIEQIKDQIPDETSAVEKKRINGWLLHFNKAHTNLKLFIKKEWLMWIWLVAVAGNHISAVMLRPGYELGLLRFENKHTNQIEPGDMRLETSQKIISNVTGLIHFSSTHMWSVYYMRVLVSLWKMHRLCVRRKRASFYPLYLHLIEENNWFPAYLHSYMDPLCCCCLDSKPTHLGYQETVTRNYLFGKIYKKSRKTGFLSPTAKTCSEHRLHLLLGTYKEIKKIDLVVAWPTFNISVADQMMSESSESHN